MNITPVLLQTSTDYNNDGEPDDIITYSYNSDGTVSREETDYDVDGEIDEFKEYLYKEDGSTSISTYDYNTDLLYAITYDKAGRVILEDGNGYYDERRYDDNDNLVYVSYSSAGEGGGYAYYNYNANNDLTTSEDATCGYDGCYVDHAANIYDSQNKLIQTISYSEETYDYQTSREQTSLFTYDNNSNLVKKESYSFYGDSFY